jgi:hypothetical protein
MMENFGEHKLAYQIGAWGVYAHVKLTVVTRPEPNGLTFVVARHIRGEFPDAIAAGLDMGWQIARRTDPTMTGLSVRIDHLGWNPVDSTPVSIAYAAAAALLNALSLDRLLPPFQSVETLEKLAEIFDKSTVE